MVMLAMQLKRVTVILQFCLRQFLSSLVQHWFGIVMLLHVSAFIIQVNFILPFEIAAVGHMGSLASVLFLPHAVRVLSVWLIGPKAFFALFPASLFISFLFLRHEYDTFTLFLITLWGASSAVISFEFLRFMNLNVYPKNTASINWRLLVFAGCLASFINSLGGTFLKSEGLAPFEILELLTRYLIGDIGGLLFCLVVLMLALRYDRLSKGAKK
jgi:hypothetical protein